MKNNGPLHTTTKKIIIAIIAIGILAITATSIVIFLRSTEDKTTTPTDSISATAIITAYAEPSAINGLSDISYKQQSNTPATIQYKLADKKYEISTPTNKSLLFYALDKAQTDDTVNIQDQTTKFMEQKNLQKTSNPDSVDTNYLQYTTFNSNNAVCQLTDSQPENQDTLRFHQLSCIDKTDIEDEYTAIESLLSIYRQNQQLTDFTQATKYTATEDNKDYSIINIAQNDKHLNLLFAAIDDNWAYLGDLAAGEPEYSNGKYSITPDLKAKIDDPIYNGFIAKYVY